jgi:hypothetical protein
VNPVHCVPKKWGLTMVKNEKNELIPQRTMTVHPRFLFNHNSRSTLLTTVKPRSTWVLTSKTLPTNPNDPIGQVNTHVGSSYGQMYGQTLPKP